MGALRFYVARLTDDECRAIHREGTEWEKRGKIGDGPLRLHAREWAVASGLSEHNISLWMREIVAEVWRRYAVPALEQSAPEDGTSDENISTQSKRRNSSFPFDI